MSDTKTSIYKKLLEFQKKNISIKKGSKNPHFKSTYADINEVLEKVKDSLSELGVVLIQIPQEEGLRTVLHDTESGTEIESYLKYTNISDPQKLGSNITYFRRYSLVALLGLEDDDDDGNAATKATAPEKKLSIKDAFKSLREAKSVSDLESRYKALPTAFKKDDEVIAVGKEVKETLINEESVIPE